MDVFLQQLVNGLTVGSLYALIALGYTMIYGVLKIINFAHGDILMLGTFIGLIFAKMGLGFIPALLVAMLITAGIGLLVERVAYRPVRTADKLIALLSALGVSIFLVNFAQLVWGTQTHSFPVNISGKPIQLWGIYISVLQIWILGISLVLMAILHYFVNHTRTGVRMRATAYHIDCARLMGINVDQIISATFAVGSALAAAAGMLIGVYYDAVYPVMGYTAWLKAFTAAVLGGIGSIPGAMFGGLLLGVLENEAAAYLSAGYKDAIAFALLILILLVRPAGLLGKNEQQKV